MGWDQKWATMSRDCQRLFSLILSSRTLRPWGMAPKLDIRQTDLSVKWVQERPLMCYLSKGQSEASMYWKLFTCWLCAEKQTHCMLNLCHYLLLVTKVASEEQCKVSDFSPANGTWRDKLLVKEAGASDLVQKLTLIIVDGNNSAMSQIAQQP